MKRRTANRRHELGRRGEEAAVAYLQAHGYIILDRNFRCRWGEIDIVARQARTLVFVEVRTRTASPLGSAEESIGPQKKARLRRLAAYYLYRTGRGEVDCRFDVIAITADANGNIRELRLFTDAF